MTTIVSPTGAREVELNSPFLWTLFLGPFYFSYHRMWLTALVSAFLAIITSGISVIIYPFFAEKMILNHYAGMGWTVKRQARDITDMPEYKK